MYKLNQSGVIHITVLFLLLVGLGSLYYLTNYTTINLKPKAYDNNQSSVSDYTNLVLKFKNSFASNDQDFLQIEDILLTRKQLLVEMAKTNPKTFLNNATLTTDFNNFPEQSKKFIEKEVNLLEGTISIMVTDYIDNQKDKYSYVFSSDNYDYILYFTEKPQNLISGSKYKISGVGIDDIIVINNSQGVSNQPTLLSNNTSSETNPNPTQIKLLVVPVSTNSLNPDINVEDVKNILFGHTNSLATFFNLNSYGEISITGDVLDWQKIDLNTSRCTDEDKLNWSRIIDQQINVNLSEYYSVIYVFPKIPACGNTYGAGYLSEPNKTFKTPFKSWILNQNNKLGVYVHELGHNLGLRDSNFLDCNDNPVSNYENCKEKVQYDQYDPMGTGFEINSLSPYHFSVLQKLILGWINFDNVPVVTKSGEYHIIPQESGIFSNERGLVISKPNTHDYYYLEYRQPLNFDSRLPKYATNGVIMHIWNEKPTDTTKLININAPEKTVFNFYDGKQYHDDVNKITIKQLRHNENGVDVEITLD